MNYCVPYGLENEHQAMGIGQSEPWNVGRIWSIVWTNRKFLYLIQCSILEDHHLYSRHHENHNIYKMLWRLFGSKIDDVTGDILVTQMHAAYCSIRNRFWDCTLISLLYYWTSGKLS